MRALLCVFMFSCGVESGQVVLDGGNVYDLSNFSMQIPAPPGGGYSGGFAPCQASECNDTSFLKAANPARGSMVGAKLR